MNRRTFLASLGGAAGTALAGCIRRSGCIEGYSVELQPTTQSGVVRNAYRSLDELDNPSYRRYVLSKFVDAPTETSYTGFPSGSIRDGELIELNDDFYEANTTYGTANGRTYRYDVTVTDAIPDGQRIYSFEELAPADKEALLHNNAVLIQRVNGDPADVNAFFTNNNVTASFEYRASDVDDGLFTGTAPIYLSIGNFIFVFTNPSSRQMTYEIATVTLSRVATSPSEAQSYALNKEGKRLNTNELTEDDEAILDAARGREVTVCVERRGGREPSEQQLSSSTQEALRNPRPRYVMYKDEWYQLIYRDFTA